MIRPAAVLLILFAVAACEGLAGGSQVTSAADETHPPKPAGCAIDVYRSQPPGPFIRVAQLNARLQGAGTAAATLDQLLPALKEQACAAGADAIADLSERHGTEAGSDLYIVTAQAIRFSAR
jgi:hypothetical protein